MALSLLLPAGGLGMPTCQFKMVTHLPCLGCGLTRSFIGVAHMHLARAAFFHPIGIPLFLLTLLMGGLLPAPSRSRERLAEWSEGHGRLLNGVGIGLLSIFLLYGLGRLAFCVMLLGAGRPIPW